jgi:4-amino-4-deoxy-L-arabinose transferase-like glycosyltransferase
MLSGTLFGGLGGAEKVWVARLPGALAGLLTAVLTLWSGARLFGRTVGLLSAVVLVSMWEFYFYSGQAEDDIYLALLVALAYACFIADRFPFRSRPERSHPWWSPLRPLPVLAFFLATGATAWAKGPGVGVLQILATCLAFAILSRDKALWQRYLHPLGFLLTAALVLAWPTYAYLHQPTLLANLKYDLNGPFGHQPFWYYALSLLWTTQPWTFAIVLGLIHTWKSRRDAPQSAAIRFVWCWALAPVLIASLSARKHHHYLVPMLPAYAVLAGVGLHALWTWVRTRTTRTWEVALTFTLVGVLPAATLMILGALGKLPGPPWAWAALPAGLLVAVTGYCMAVVRRSGLGVLASVFTGLAIFLAYGQGVLAARDESGKFDITMVSLASSRLDPSKTVYLIADNQLDFFRLQWYLRPPTTVLQNATYLRDQRITDPWVYVLTRDGKTNFLTSELGQLDPILQSPHSRKEKDLGGKFTLYQLTFRPDLKRYPAPPVGVAQAMWRYDAAPPGPWCGPPPETKEKLAAPDE